MYQRGKQRETAEENPICVNCKDNSNCTTKPLHHGWRFVLDYCQDFKDVTES